MLYFWLRGIPPQEIMLYFLGEGSLPKGPRALGPLGKIPTESTGRSDLDSDHEKHGWTLVGHWLERRWSGATPLERVDCHATLGIVRFMTSHCVAVGQISI